LAAAAAEPGLASPLPGEHRVPADALSTSAGEEAAQSDSAPDDNSVAPRVDGHCVPGAEQRDEAHLTDSWVATEAADRFPDDWQAELASDDCSVVAARARDLAPVDSESPADDRLASLSPADCSVVVVLVDCWVAVVSVDCRVAVVLVDCRVAVVSVDCWVVVVLVDCWVVVVLVDCWVVVVLVDCSVAAVLVDCWVVVVLVDCSVVVVLVDCSVVVVLVDWVQEPDVQSKLVDSPDGSPVREPDGRWSALPLFPEALASPSAEPPRGSPDALHFASRQWLSGMRGQRLLLLHERHGRRRWCPFGHHLSARHGNGRSRYLIGTRRFCPENTLARWGHGNACTHGSSGNIA
jgi:hypothetical protein